MSVGAGLEPGVGLCEGAGTKLVLGIFSVVDPIPQLACRAVNLTPSVNGIGLTIIIV